MKKKIVALCLVLALALTAIGGATLAYFTDTDADVNVMTTGKVDIEQNEKDDAGNDFDQNQPLFPAPEDTYDSENHIDKVVTVTNTGNVAAYVRTLFAFEDNGSASDDMHVLWGRDVVTENPPEYIKYPTAGGQYLWFNATITDAEGKTTVDKYVVGYVNYETPLAAGATSTPSMMEIWLDTDAGNEWTDKVGATYDILVLSQAAQEEGFENADDALNTAFGEVSVANAAEVASWFLASLQAKNPGCTVTVAAA